MLQKLLPLKSSEDVAESIESNTETYIETKDNELCFVTKGDANNTNDDGIVYSNMVEGKYQTKIAKLGNAILFIQEPIGFVVMLMSILIICLLVYSFQSKKISKEEKFKTEEERQAFEEFMKMRAEKNKK